MSFLVGYLILAAWTEPTASPPGGNVPPPLNTSLNAQSKEGALVLGTNLNPASTTLIIQNGLVGIGTTNPAYKLHVAGSINASTSLCISGDCKTSWPAGGTNYWTLSGSNLYPNQTTYNVGIGTTSPSSILEVNAGQSSKLRITTTPAGQAGNYTVNWNALEICQFGTCCPPWKDCDGDGKTYQAGTDCDEGCATCYNGSLFNTISPDGKDQDCNGIVDNLVTNCTWGYDGSCNWLCGGHYIDPRGTPFCPTGYTQSTYGVGYWTTGDSITCGGHAWWGQGAGGTSYTGYKCQRNAYW